ncbi:hypothetical protein ASZ90_004271 [hydrocarbon metagenome]|uniref:Cytotoxic translational repressor of toxin-antitoxin stability system n=1 Tax=hydrocarbon metagenome TaxID=938273 RepID=A0A0W8FYA6_9ZZZZ
MLKLKTKWFNKWAKKNSVSDKILFKTIQDLSENLGTINLGAGLYKIRTAKSGQGKSGGHRTIVVYKESDIVIFVYGFSKIEKDNLSKEEFKYFKKLAKDLLSIDKNKYKQMIQNGDFVSIGE